MPNQITKRKLLSRLIKLILLSTILTSLTACPIEKNPPSPPPPPPTPTLAQQIKALEDSGAYPKLDRSTDLKGPDQNLNGVRDDVEAWINAQPITDVQKKAAMQDAEVFQRTLLVDLTDKAALQSVGDAMAAATVCTSEVFKSNSNAGYMLSNKIEAITFNTKERTMRYIAYNQARSGSTTKLPSGNTCK